MRGQGKKKIKAGSGRAKAQSRRNIAKSPNLSKKEVNHYTEKIREVNAKLNKIRKEISNLESANAKAADAKSAAAGGDSRKRHKTGNNGEKVKTETTYRTAKEHEIAIIKRKKAYEYFKKLFENNGNWSRSNLMEFYERTKDLKAGELRDDIFSRYLIDSKPKLSKDYIIRAIQFDDPTKWKNNSRSQRVKKFLQNGYKADDAIKAQWEKNKKARIARTARAQHERTKQGRLQNRTQKGLISHIQNWGFGAATPATKLVPAEKLSPIPSQENQTAMSSNAIINENGTSPKIVGFNLLTALKKYQRLRPNPHKDSSFYFLYYIIFDVLQGPERILWLKLIAQNTKPGGTTEILNFLLGLIDSVNYGDDKKTYNFKFPTPSPEIMGVFVVLLWIDGVHDGVITEGLVNWLNNADIITFINTSRRGRWFTFYFQNNNKYIGEMKKYIEGVVTWFKSKGPRKTTARYFTEFANVNIDVNDEKNLLYKFFAYYPDIPIDGSPAMGGISKSVVSDLESDIKTNWEAIFGGNIPGEMISEKIVGPKKIESKTGPVVLSSDQHKSETSILTRITNKSEDPEPSVLTLVTIASSDAGSGMLPHSIRMFATDLLEALERYVDPTTSSPLTNSFENEYTYTNFGNKWSWKGKKNKFVLFFNPVTIGDGTIFDFETKYIPFNDLPEKGILPIKATLNGLQVDLSTSAKEAAGRKASESTSWIEKTNNVKKDLNRLEWTYKEINTIADLNKLIAGISPGEKVKQEAARDVKIFIEKYLASMLGKLFGDLLQILMALGLTKGEVILKNRSLFNEPLKVFFGTGDGSAVGISAFCGNYLFKIVSRMVIDYSRAHSQWGLVSSVSDEVKVDYVRSSYSHSAKRLKTAKTGKTPTESSADSNRVFAKAWEDATISTRKKLEIMKNESSHLFNLNQSEINVLNKKGSLQPGQFAELYLRHIFTRQGFLSPPEIKEQNELIEKFKKVRNAVLDRSNAQTLDQKESLLKQVMDRMRTSRAINGNVYNIIARGGPEGQIQYMKLFIDTFANILKKSPNAVAISTAENMFKTRAVHEQFREKARPSHIDFQKFRKLRKEIREIITEPGLHGEILREIIQKYTSNKQQQLNTPAGVITIMEQLKKKIENAKTNLRETTKNTPGINKFANKYTMINKNKVRSYIEPLGRRGNRIKTVAEAEADVVDAEAKVVRARGNITTIMTQIQVAGKDTPAAKNLATKLKPAETALKAAERHRDATAAIYSATLLPAVDQFVESQRGGSSLHSSSNGGMEVNGSGSPQ